MDYGDWNRRLEERFFGCGKGTQPVVFFVDDDVLADLHPSGDPAVACADLAQAVRARIRPGTRDLFSVFLREHEAWADGAREDPPPSLGLLAMTVNAATHMHAGEQWASTNYYVRVRELIGLEPEGGEPAGFGPAMRCLWPDLHEWLEARGRGRSTIRGHHHWTNIGYSLSQALFRESDLVRLPYLFDYLGLPPFDAWDPENPPASPRELRIHYAVWSANAQGLSPGARRIGADPNYQEMLEEILWESAREWPGYIQTDGRLMLRLVLALEAPMPPRFHLWASRRSGMPETLVLDGGLELSGKSSEWYEESPIPIDPGHLETGFGTSAGDSYRFEFQPESVLPLREENDFLFEWVAVARVSPEERHWLLVSELLKEDVDRYLETYAEAGWSHFGQGAVPGWLLYRDVEINRAPPLDLHPALHRLRPNAGVGLALRGGLPLREFGAATYLTKGAPDVFVPSGLLDESGEDVVLGETILQGMDGEGGRLPLRPLALGAGAHTVRVGQRSLSFHLLHSTEQVVHPESGKGGLSFNAGPSLRLRSRRVGPFDESGLAEVRVSGAVIKGLPDDHRRPVRLRRRANESVLLGARPGEIYRPREPEEPPWLVRIGLPSSYFDVAPLFEAAWSLQRFGRDLWRIDCLSRSLHPEAPQPDASSRDVADWAGLIVVNGELFESAVPLGPEYLAAAISLDGV